MSDSNPDPTQVSATFCAEDADVTFQSSDGVLFRIHRKNLETNAAGFPPSGFDTRNEVVPLAETSETLELLFQFMYPKRHPDLETATIEILAPLAEAAEKYEVFSALNMCKVRMKNALPQHPYEVMVYAAKHGYSQMVGEAAPLLLDTPLNDMIQKLPEHMAMPWVLYYERWRQIYDKALFPPSWNLGRQLSAGQFYDDRGMSSVQVYMACTQCGLNVDSLFAQLVRELKGLQCLTKFDTVGNNLRCCSHIRSLIGTWRISISQQTQQIPAFDKFL